MKTEIIKPSSFSSFTDIRKLWEATNLDTQESYIVASATQITNLYLTEV